MVSSSLLVYLVVRTQGAHTTALPDDFFLYDRAMPDSQFVPTYVTTNIGLFSSIAYSTILAYYYGIAGMVFTTLAWFMGMYWFSRHIRTLLPFLKTGSTIHEYIAITYGGASQQHTSLLRAWTSLISALLYFASIGIEIKFSADMLAPSLGQLQSTVIAFAIAIVGLTYAYLSGYRGIVYTDKIQYYIMLCSSIVTFAFVFFIGYAHGFSFGSDSFKSYFNFPFIIAGPDPFGLLGMVILLILYQFCIMDMWQRCIASSKTKDSQGHFLPDDALEALLRRKIFKDAILPFLILFVVWFMIGILALGLKLTDDQSTILSAFLGAFDGFGRWGYLAKAIVVTGFVAAAISTVDGFLIATVQTLMYDVYGTVIVKGLSDNLHKLNPFQQYRFVNIAKIGIILIGFLSVFIAFFKFELMNFWTSMYSIMLSFFPAVYEGIKGRSNMYTYIGVRNSIICGSSLALICGVTGTFIIDNSFVVALAPISAVVLAAIILKIDKKAEQSKTTVLSE